ncbi:hypothetical protein G6F65_020456 [Rhizopus arrhizus]|nr:hypothetical protein G6F65_020456 [Rhizopus arrhizus]
MEVIVKIQLEFDILTKHYQGGPVTQQVTAHSRRPSFLQAFLQSEALGGYPGRSPLLRGTGHQTGFSNRASPTQGNRAALDQRRPDGRVLPAGGSGDQARGAGWPIARRRKNCPAGHRRAGRHAGAGGDLRAGQPGQPRHPARLGDPRRH